MAKDNSSKELKKAESLMRKERRRRRQKRLNSLLKAIKDGDIDSKKVPVDELFNNKIAPRQQYISPDDRSSYNYQYMELDEMLAGTPNIWR